MKQLLLILPLLILTHLFTYMGGRSNFIKGLTVGYGEPYYSKPYYGKCIKNGKYCVINENEHKND